MRDLFLLATILPIWGFALRRPYIGLLGWAWLSIMVPHQLAWGIAQQIPVVQITAMVTILGWALNAQTRKIPRDRVAILMLVFLAWTGVTTLFALDPAFSYPYWDECAKAVVFGLFALLLLDTRTRLQAFIWILVVSIGFYAVKGAVWSILTGGAFILKGPPHSPITDRNHLALAMLTILPLIYYLLVTSRERLVRWGLGAGMALTVLAVLGTHSRGALVGLCATGAVLWWRAPRRWTMAGALGVAVLAGLLVMPVDWFERMATLQAAMEDRSFQARLLAWDFAYNLANARLLGGGFTATEIPLYFQTYSPGAAEFGKPMAAAHSIYFQVLGDHGYIGLALYLLVLATSFVNLEQVRRRTRGAAGQLWLHQLAGTLQVSLVAYCVTGAALSMAYTDLLMGLLGLSAAVRVFFLHQAAAAPAETVRAGFRPRFADDGQPAAPSLSASSFSPHRGR